MSNNLYFIAECNGTGKTTDFFTILPEILDCRGFTKVIPVLPLKRTPVW